MKSMAKWLLCLMLGLAFGLVLPVFADPTAGATMSRQAEKCLSVAARKAPTADTLDLEEFLLSLDDGQEPVPAAGCTISTICWSTSRPISCSGSTFCYRVTGCSVNCDDVEYECPCCGGYGHECP